jgi:asparagine synthase (glutamine-hydrolysing)
MIADVPLGAFLSGGIDSSTIVALMQAQSSLPVKTFTIGFHEAGYDEAGYARAVARHLGTEHTELYVTSREAQAVIPELPALYDEPFSDSSQIPTYLVAKLARQHVTVSLSGDGGDELFGGYPRYARARQVWKWTGWMPPALRLGLAGCLDLKPLQRSQTLGSKAYHLGETLKAGSREQVYLKLLSHWVRPEEVVIGGSEPKTLLTDPAHWADLPDFTAWMMYQDLMMYLPDDILVKLDRASMGVSLEGRVPFLDDHRVMEFAWRLPLRMKARPGQEKWVLRQVLYRHVPRELIERPKMGFGVPIGAWLRGELRPWAEELLDEGRLKQEGFFNPAPIRRKWQEHLTGVRDWQYHLWDILMFQAWWRR